MAGVARLKYMGKYRDVVERSLITLRALIYRPTGGIVAAVTTSLPEFIGGVRNWDYRYCWSTRRNPYAACARQWRLYE